MKKLLCLIVLLGALTSCKNDKKDVKNYASLSGEIANLNTKTLLLANSQLGFQKNIKVDENGVFKDTFSLKKGIYSLKVGATPVILFLRNGDSININSDANNVNETLSLTGIGYKESAFLVKSMESNKKFLENENLFKLTKNNFDAKVNDFINDFNGSLGKSSKDSLFIAQQKENANRLKQYVERIYPKKNFIFTKLNKGTPSPKFTKFENYEGGTMSLDDLKGKYVYIDVWATWCFPCKKEIPYLKSVEKQYHNKNIVFVSISTDAKRNYDTWKKMIKDKEMGGVQLYANEDQSFSRAYFINSIPRFILIDPQGNIVDADAPRPSDPRLIELFNSLEI
ncbi:Thioredoxin domain-containing protein [Tenacibaculum sp. 190524A02b]|uniref:Thioredoxin domain-containing protein n=1 Tax=Tenacibaculum vairaonense TaxID=3137860 RepID=A0ABM9PMH7_9FLAO